MKPAALLFLAAGALSAQPHIDNVLVKMVPPGTVSLAGARMDQIKATAFYAKLADQSKLPQLDQFAADTGFDPRRDVREVLYASGTSGTVLLARGTFNIRHEPVTGQKLIRHGSYIIRSLGDSGFCILDKTLAAAGDLKTLEASLDEWKSGAHTAAQPLLALAKNVDPAAQFWGVSSGFAGFLAEHMPRAASGVDFSRIFKGLEDTWFDVSFSTGLRGEVHGMAAAEADAINLRDAAKGLIGFGRLSVPENHPEMLKLWDGITVDQQGRNVSVKADIPQNMVDELARLMQSVTGRGR